MPQDLMEAIAHANKILDWYANVPSDEIPPEWMWPFNEELNEWFDDIKAQKAADSGNEAPVTMTKNEDPRLMKARALRG